MPKATQGEPGGRKPSASALGKDQGPGLLCSCCHREQGRTPEHPKDRGADPEAPARALAGTGMFFVLEMNELFQKHQRKPLETEVENCFETKSKEVLAFSQILEIQIFL